MALDYDLELSTSITPRQALEILASKILRLTWNNEGRWLLDSTVTISATETLEIGKEVIKEGFHFVPTISVGFRLSKDGDRARFREVLLQAAMLLMEHAEDVVLLFNGEQVILQRLGGKLAFNADSGLWRDGDWLKRTVTTPFELRPLPSPYL